MKIGVLVLCEFDDSRLSLTKMFMNVAKEIAQRSPCPKGKRHGAVAVRDKRLVATGYNGPPAGEAHCNPCSLTSDLSGKDWRTCPAVHAEENVVANAARHGTAIGECVLVVTKKPCNRCLGIMINAGIKEVLYFED